jgi:hypothetical protein
VTAIRWATIVVGVVAVVLVAKRRRRRRGYELFSGSRPIAGVGSISVFGGPR